MSHPVWIGYLSFGLISMPVRAFAAARPETISLCFLHRSDHSRVGQQFYCKTENKVVPHSELVKAWEYGPDQYVTIEKEDLEAIEPETADEMKVLQFVKLSAIDPIYLESAYYLLPEDAGAHAYALLAQALKKSGHAAVAQLAMHNREHTVVILPKDNGLALHTLYYADEVRKIEGFGECGTVGAKEVKLVERLVRALAGEWKPEKFRDSYRVNLKALIDAKVAGEQPKAKTKRKKLAPVIDLSAAIRESLAAVEAHSPQPAQSDKSTKAKRRA